MPNYILSYGPILFVMVANPLIYMKCSKEVDRQLIQRYGQYTNNERQIHDMFKIKFSLINVIFYFCWLPNIVNAILMWTMWFHLPVRVIIISWYIIAVLNPLQAFLNALVYRKWNNKMNCYTSLKNYLTRKFRGTIIEAPPQDETSPLLHNTPIQPQHSFSRSGSRNFFGASTAPAESDANFHRYSIQCPCV